MWEGSLLSLDSIKVGKQPMIIRTPKLIIKVNTARDEKSHLKETDWKKQTKNSKKDTPPGN